ncbi:hypothetical protein ATM97_06930 [Nocardia sp. MH4]|uniref:hypothetical protein n=1 Tax=Nocardia sp. MH4 TaxID=1768677 RepID=UPI001C4F6A29|nr:hypothetical protein [Nocardia sp. MH4]MBW0270747.1 hypothetical protein [Nocardia sp. MH4]
MTRDGLRFTTDLARASVPLAAIVLMWCALTWDSPTYLALALLAVVASCAAVRPDSSPGADPGISPPDAGDQLHASGGPPNPQ